MDVSNTPSTRIAEPYDPAGCPPICPDVAKVVEAVRRDLEQMKRDGKEFPLPRSYTIREAVEKTGRPRREIYRLIQKGEIEARMITDGPALWLVPEKEVDARSIGQRG